MRKTLFVLLLGTGLLAACGSDGSGEDDTAPPTPALPTTNAVVAVSGTAAKGLMVNADVGVYAVDAAGQVAEPPLATTTTDAQGRYSLQFAGNQDQPYVVRVGAKAGTTHADEVTGTAQALPVGFQMRSLVIPAATGTVTTSASITPFTEMAVAAASRAAGGISLVNATQAVSTVSQLLGFNPIAVTPTTAAGAASGDEQKLAVLLLAVSQLAHDGALGCSSGSAGDQTQCVVDALGAAATTTSIKLGSGAAGSVTDVSGALSGAIGEVLAKPGLVGAIGSASLATVMANLGCAAPCAAAPVGTTPTVDKAASAIAGAKLLFAEIKSDWTAMFSRHGTSSIATGAANLQASKFENTMREVYLPVRTLLSDSGALLMGIDLYNDFKAGRTVSPNRNRAFDNIANDGSADFSRYPAVGCSLVQDLNTLAVATVPGNANVIYCGARYYLTRTYTASGYNTNEYRHLFTITPNADGSFGWQTNSRLRVITNTGIKLTDTNLQADSYGTALPPFTGTVTTTLGKGQITAFTMVGDWPAGFEEKSTTLASHHHTVSLSGTRVIDPDTANMETASVAGSVVAKDSTGATLSRLTIKNASLKSAPVSREQYGSLVSPSSPFAVEPAGSEISGGKLNLVFTTPTAEFEGLFEISESAWDKSGIDLKPTRLRLSGALRNIENGVSTEFLSGDFSAISTGYASFDATQPYSETNRYSVDMSFSGSITAPARPVLQVSFGGTQLMDSDNGHTQGMTLQYRTLVAGKPRLVVAVTGSRNAATGEIDRFKLTEASANLTLEWAKGAATVNLVHDGLVIGVVDTGSGLVTFSDNSFVSLDIGL